MAIDISNFSLIDVFCGELLEDLPILQYHRHRSLYSNLHCQLLSPTSSTRRSSSPNTKSQIKNDVKGKNEYEEIPERTIPKKLTLVL